MSITLNPRTLSCVLLLTIAALCSPGSFAKAVEQKVRLKVVDPGDGSQCMVQAVFKGDHDNCKNDKAKGRDN